MGQFWDREFVDFIDLFYLSHFYYLNSNSKKKLVETPTLGGGRNQLWPRFGTVRKTSMKSITLLPETVPKLGFVPKLYHRGLSKTRARDPGKRYSRPPQIGTVLDTKSELSP